jgi:hypothetical protein
VFEHKVGSRWGPEGPPQAAYGRVTNPKRFAPLHRVATELLDRLERDFNAHRTQRYGLDPDLERDCTLAGATVRLAPSHEWMAPIVVAFSTFPGLRVRFGRWCIRAFPQCGCDACDETTEGEAEHLTWMTRNVIAGRFREVIRFRSDGTIWNEWESWSEGTRTQQTFKLDSDAARRLLAEGGGSSFSWAPWPRR